MACCPICCHRMRMNFNERPWCMVSSIEEPAATRLPFPFVMIYKENNRGRLFFTFTLWCVGFWRALHYGWNFQILSLSYGIFLLSQKMKYDSIWQYIARNDQKWWYDKRIKSSLSRWIMERRYFILHSISFPRNFY